VRLWPTQEEWRDLQPVVLDRVDDDDGYRWRITVNIPAAVTLIVVMLIITQVWR
jgi:hypothetical protein